MLEIILVICGFVILQSFFMRLFKKIIFLVSIFTVLSVRRKKMSVYMIG